MAIRSARVSLAITPANAMLTHYNNTSGNNINHTIMAIRSAINFGNNISQYKTTVREKYVKMYERFIAELKSYSKAIRILSKGYLPILLIPPSKLEAIFVQ